MRCKFKNIKTHKTERLYIHKPSSVVLTENEMYKEMMVRFRTGDAYDSGYHYTRHPHLLCCGMYMPVPVREKFGLSGMYFLDKVIDIVTCWCMGGGNDDFWKDTIGEFGDEFNDCLYLLEPDAAELLYNELNRICKDTKDSRMYGGCIGYREYAVKYRNEIDRCVYDAMMNADKVLGRLPKIAVDDEPLYVYKDKVDELITGIQQVINEYKISLRNLIDDKDHSKWIVNRGILNPMCYKYITKLQYSDLMHIVQKKSRYINEKIEDLENYALRNLNGMKRFQLLYYASGQ